MLAFCHIPKAAGTAVQQVLRSWYGMGHYDIPTERGRYHFMRSDDIDWIRKRWPGVECICGHNLSPAYDLSAEDRPVHWFTFLRDPVKRYVSHYQYYINVRWGGAEKISFEDWLELDHHKNTQVKMIADDGDLEKAVRILNERVSVVGLQEQYSDSMKMLASFTGNFYVPDIVRNRKNVATSRHVEKRIHEQYSRYERKLLEANSLDLELYRYVSEELFPSHRDKLLADYAPEGGDSRGVRLKMKCNWYANYAVRNGVRRPLRKPFFRLVGFGNNEL